MIELRDVSKIYQIGEERVHALDHANLHVYPKEFVSIIGPSGSGKSTLMNIIGCLDVADGGQYLLDGMPIEAYSENELANVRNRKIGFVFQSFNLIAKLSAEENVELPLLYSSGISASERRRRALEALDMVGLSDRVNHLPNQMSGGQQQRVAIARALVNDPVIILADEATGNLDTRTSYEIMMIFQELHRQGKTIAFVTHEPDIATFSERTITLRDGLVKKDETHEMQDAKAAFDALPPPETYD